jgi:hypothetical protein
MFPLRLAAVAGLCLGVAAAASVTAEASPPTTQVCVASDGAATKPTCRGRACSCKGDGILTIAPVCAPGESPALDITDANRARREAAVTKASWVGGSFAGRPFCVVTAASKRPSRSAYYGAPYDNGYIGDQGGIVASTIQGNVDQGTTYTQTGPG